MSFSTGLQQFVRLFFIRLNDRHMYQQFQEAWEEEGFCKKVVWRETAAAQIKYMHAYIIRINAVNFG